MRDVLSRPTMLKSMDTSTWFPAGSAAPCYMSIHALRIISTSRPELSCWKLDPSDYQAALEHARADLATREATARSAGVNVPITNASAFSQLRLAEAAHEEAIAAVDSEEANLAAAQHKVQQNDAVYSRAERDRVRWQGLVDGGVVSRSEYDAREAEALADAQQLEADRATVTAEQHKIAQARSLIAQRAAHVVAAGTAPQQLSDARATPDSTMG